MAQVREAVEKEVKEKNLDETEAKKLLVTTIKVLALSIITYNQHCNNKVMTIFFSTMDFLCPMTSRSLLLLTPSLMRALLKRCAKLYIIYPLVTSLKFLKEILPPKNAQSNLMQGKLGFDQATHRT